MAALAEFVRYVAGEPDADDQYHHQPNLTRIEDPVRSGRFDSAKLATPPWK